MEIDPNAWYWFKPDGWAAFKARGHEIQTWTNEGRTEGATWWPVPKED
jgi:hypothetical protein